MLSILYDITTAVFEAVLHAAFVLSLLYLAITAFVLTTRRRKIKVPLTEPAELPSVTVQIPTYNEPAALNCAQRCLDFDYPADRMQILIGDDSNKPEVSAMIDRFAQEHPEVRVCRRGSNTGFKPGNLNHMLPLTTGDYILVLDSDFLPERDFLRRMVQPVLDDPSLAGVQARWKVLDPCANFTTLMGAGIVNVIHVIMLPFLKKIFRTGIFCGSGELVRRDLLEAHGGWTPGVFTEDVDYSLRLLSEGRHIVYLPSAECECEVPHVPADLFRQQMRWAYGVIRAFMSHGRNLMGSRQVPLRVKTGALLFAGGYFMTMALLASTVLGVVNVLFGTVLALTGGAEPGAVFKPLETLGNVLLTCGMLVASMCAGFVNGVGLRGLSRLTLASFTMGFVLLFYVGEGVFRGLFRMRMQWFMLRKQGNVSAAAEMAV